MGTVNSTDKIALVTGAAGGLGRFAAIRWAMAGNRVFAIDSDEVGLKKLAKRHRNIRTRVADVTDHRRIKLIVEHIETDHGPIQRVDHAADFVSTDTAHRAEDFKRSMDINFGGLINVSELVLDRMLKRDSGILVHYCSEAGLFPVVPAPEYSVAQAACAAYTHVLQQQTASVNVQVIGFCVPKDAIGDSLTEASGMTMLDRLDKVIERNRTWCFVTPGARVRSWMRRPSI